MKLTHYINLILELEKQKPLSSHENSALDGFDRAILILDDVEDKSQIQDGNLVFILNTE